MVREASVPNFSCGAGGHSEQRQYSQAMEIGHQVYKIRAETCSAQQRVKRVTSKLVQRVQVILSGTMSRSWARGRGQAVVPSTHMPPRWAVRAWCNTCSPYSYSKIKTRQEMIPHTPSSSSFTSITWSPARQEDEIFTVCWGELLTWSQMKRLVHVAVTTGGKTWCCYNLIARHTGVGRGEKTCADNLSAEIFT